MEVFSRATAVRLRSHHGKYLTAEDDEEHVSQDRDGSSKGARWAVELADGAVRLKSCYGLYLAATDERFLLGATGRKVLQVPAVGGRLDSSFEWDPIRDGVQVRLRTRSGGFLRANWGPAPWRNSVTHDVPRRTATQDWVLWDVDIIDIRVQSPSVSAVSPLALTPSTLSPSVPKLTSPSYLSSLASKPPCRTIHYTVVVDNEADEGIEGFSFVEGPSFDFKGTSLDELTHALVEETGLIDIIVCSKDSQNGKLHPLLQHLPPNTMAMHVVVVPASSSVGLSWCL